MRLLARIWQSGFLVLPNKIVKVHIRLTLIYIQSSGFEKSLPEFIKVLSAKILDFMIVLKICCKLSLMYFGIEEIAQVGLKLEKLAENFVEKLRETKDPAGLLSIPKAIEVSLKSPDGVTKVRFLQG